MANSFKHRVFERSGGLCDSPLETGGGVCYLRTSDNTPLQPHRRRAPSQEGNLILRNTNGLKPFAIL